MKIFSLLFFSFMVVVCYTQINTPNRMIHRQGTQIVNGKGEKIFFKGVFLDNWLFWSGSSWNAGFASESKMNKRLSALVGDQELGKFRNAVYENLITEDDIRAIKDMGFNTVRVPFNHTVFEDDSLPYVYKESGWKIMDQLLSWCEKYQIWVIMDLHGAPGGQSGLFVADPDKVLLWESEENKKRTIALWKAIAKRYKDCSIISGYDLLNEPNLRKPEMLVELYSDIIKVVREIDPFHMIILEGAKLATDFSIFEKVLDTNCAYSIHSYSLLGPDKTKHNIQKLQKLSSKQNIPYFNGEFGANTIEWTGDMTAFFESSDINNNGWVFWPWKSVESSSKRYRHLVDIKTPESWTRLSGYLSGFGRKPSPEEALRAIKEFTEAMKYSNCSIDKEMLNKLIRH